MASGLILDPEPTSSFGLDMAQAVTTPIIPHLNAIFCSPMQRIIATAKPLCSIGYAIGTEAAQ